MLRLKYYYVAISVMFASYSKIKTTMSMIHDTLMILLELRVRTFNEELARFFIVLP